MQCQAITQKGTQCRNTAVLPEGGNPRCCRIASHIAATSTTTTPMITPTTASTTTPKRAALTLPTVPITRPASPTRAPPVAVPTVSRVARGSDDILVESRKFLSYKEEVVGILSDLLAQGMSQYNDHGRAIEHLKRRFTLDIYHITKKKLIEGLSLLEETQNKLIKVLKLHPGNGKLIDVISYYRSEADQTYKLLNRKSVV